MRNEKVYENLYKQAMERAEKAEWERDEMAALLSQYRKLIDMGSGEAIDEIMRLDWIDIDDTLRQLRAKHWREAGQKLADDLGVSMVCDMHYVRHLLGQMADEIERGE